MYTRVWKPESFCTTFEEIEQHFRHAAIVTKDICAIYGHAAVPEDDESLKEIIFRALPPKTRERVQEKMEMRSTSTLDINIGNFDFGWVKETCRQVESELRARSEYRYRSRALNSLQIEGREENIATDIIDPPLAADTSTLHYAGDRYSRSVSRTRAPPRFSPTLNARRGRSPSIKPRGIARRPGDPIPPRSRSRLTTSARVHAIVPYDPVKNADACFNCGNPGHRIGECKQPKDEARIQTNLEAFRKHRAQLVATINVMDAVSKDSADVPSDSEGSEFTLHTGDTTEAETDPDEETEDEESDLEYDHEDEEHGRTKDRHP